MTTANQNKSDLKFGTNEVPFPPRSPHPQGEIPLTHDELNAFRQQLQQTRQWLLESISRIESQAVKIMALPQGSSHGDSNNDAWMQQITTQRAIAHKRLLLNEVMQAFERINTNTFGQCVNDSSHRLSRTVLNDMPWARYCARCSARC